MAYNPYGGQSSGGYGGHGGGGYGVTGGGAGAGHGSGHGAGGGGGYQPGGFAAVPQGPPPGADPQLWSWFSAVDSDRSGAISPPELQQALVNGDWSPFDLDTVKLLMGIFDSDRSGHIGFNEFVGLWKYVKDWQGIFRHFDQDRSGSIDGNELENALNQFGYKLSPELLHLLESKYASIGRGQNGITFDRFVRCCVVIKNLTETFQRLDTNRTGVIQLNYDSFMKVILSAP